MLKENGKTVRQIYEIVYSIFSILIAFLFILQVCDIYFNGGQSPYTAQTIKTHFDKISVFVYIWVFLTVLGFILYGVFPLKEKSSKTDPFYTYLTLKKKLHARTFSDCETLKEIEKNDVFLSVLKLICGVCVGVCAVFCFAYLFNTENFSNTNQNKEMASAALYLLPFVLGSFALLFAIAFYERSLLKREIVAIKDLLSKSKGEGETAEYSLKQNVLASFKSKIDAFFRSKKTVLSIRLTVAAVGITLFIYGLATGGNAGVLAKAITICRQCIGLG